MAFPNLIGGTLVSRDLAPSIAFIAAYALLVPYTCWIASRSIAKVTMLLSFIHFERIVLFAIRVAQSRNNTWAGSLRITFYGQLSLNLGYLITHLDFLILLRYMVACFYEINITAPNWRDTMEPVATLGIFVVILCIIVNLITAIRFPTAVHDQLVSSNMYALRSIGGVLTIILVLWVCPIVYCLLEFRQPMIRCLKPVIILCLICLIINGICHMILIHGYTESILWLGPASHSSHSRKAIFYAGYMLMEWMAAALTHAIKAQLFVGRMLPHKLSPQKVKIPKIIVAK